MPSEDSVVGPGRDHRPLPTTWPGFQDAAGWPNAHGGPGAAHTTRAQARGYLGLRHAHRARRDRMRGRKGRAPAPAARPQTHSTAGLLPTATGTSVTGPCVRLHPIKSTLQPDSRPAHTAPPLPARGHESIPSLEAGDDCEASRSREWFRTGRPGGGHQKRAAVAVTRSPTAPPQRLPGHVRLLGPYRAGPRMQAQSAAPTVEVEQRRDPRERRNSSSGAGAEREVTP